VEAAGLPAVAGTPSGLTVSPCPGLTLAWSVACKTVTATLADGAAITVTSCGAVAYAAAGQSAEAFAAAAEGLVSKVQQAGDTADGAEEEDTAEPAVQLLLQQLAQPGLQGLHCFLLPAGHAAMHESERCQYAVTAGQAAPAAWLACSDLPAPALDQDASPLAAAEPSEAGASSRHEQDPLQSFEQQQEQQQGAPQQQQPTPQRMPPRLFVIDPSGKSGYELLDSTQFERYCRAREATAGCSISRRPLVNAQDEPGAACWCFVTRHQPVDAGLPQLPVYCGVQPVAYTVQQAGPGAVPGLRKPSTFRPAPPPAGPFLPRVCGFQPRQEHLRPAPAPAITSRTVIEYPALAAEQQELIQQVRIGACCEAALAACVIDMGSAAINSHRTCQPSQAHLQQCTV
jgi:hypothetical protein